MTNKDEASPRQRIIMEQRWAKARQECPAGTCVPSSRFHVQGCTRRDNRKVTIAPEEGQKVQVTNLNTGETREVEILHSDVTAVKNVLKEQGGQATRLEPGGVLLVPEELDFPQAYWDHTEARFERNQRDEVSRPRLLSTPRPEDVRALTPQEQEMRDSLMVKLEREREMMPAPARPWWKFWGRRG